MFVVQNIKYPAVYTHVNSTQTVAIWHDNKKRTYTPRFYVNNYQPGEKRHPQRSFKSFKTKGEAMSWAEEVCSKLSKHDSFDVFALQRIVKEMKTNAYAIR